MEKENKILNNFNIHLIIENKEKLINDYILFLDKLIKFKNKNNITITLFGIMLSDEMVKLIDKLNTIHENLDLNNIDDTNNINIVFDFTSDFKLLYYKKRIKHPIVHKLLTLYYIETKVSFINFLDLDMFLVNDFDLFKKYYNMDSILVDDIYLRLNNDHKIIQDKIEDVQTLGTFLDIDTSHIIFPNCQILFLKSTYGIFEQCFNWYKIIDKSSNREIFKLCDYYFIEENLITLSIMNFIRQNKETQLIYFENTLVQKDNILFKQGKNYIFETLYL